MKSIFKKRKLSLKEQKDQAILEIQKATKELKEKYFNIIVPIKVAYEQLIIYTIPELSKLPDKLISQAKEYKKLYHSENIEAYKTNALKMLRLHQEAVNNLNKIQETKNKLEYTIKTNEAEFKSRIFELDIAKTELEASINLPEVNFIDTIGNINEIKTGISKIFHNLEIDREVNKIINGDLENNVTPEKFENDDEKLFEDL